MKNILFSILTITTLHSSAQTNQNDLKKRQETIIEEYLNNCAKKYNYNRQMSEWQNCLDEGLKKDSTIAYLWQQKAMPYFKARKYEIGMPLINKAVAHDAQRWQPYRAFIKCIFAKTYKDAIIDFEDCITKYGNGYIMDHPYSFYIGLSYLQLNEFNKAEIIFKEYIDYIFKNRQELEHPTAYFYYGISQYEQKKYDEALITFNKALNIYPNFSDVKYYKSICMATLYANQEDISKIFKEAKEDAKKGYTINEDNTIYETYPYQKKWKD